MNLRHANCVLLQQGIDLLARHDARTFVATDASSFGSGIGTHLRHVLDHYRSFLNGAESGLIDYDKRERDTQMERDRESALVEIRSIRERIERCRVDPDGEVEVRVSASTDGAEDRSVSTFGRELQFLVSHTVHHYALMAIASRMQGIFPDESFGVAPSTLKHIKALQS